LADFLPNKARICPLPEGNIRQSIELAGVGTIVRLSRQALNDGHVEARQGLAVGIRRNLAFRLCRNQ